MKKHFTQFKALMFLIIIMIASIQLSAQDYEKKVFRFKFNKTEEARLSSMKLKKGTDGIVRTGITSVDQLSEKFNASSIRRVFPHAGKYEAKHQKYGLHLWYEVVIDKKVDALEAAKEYGNLQEVSIAEPVYNKTRGYNNGIKGISGSLPIGTNDPQYASQWHYNNTGQTGGTVDADIDLPEAWIIETGSPDVIVSVHDGGIDIDHVDLAGNMWINPGEIAGNNIDDDNNGYIDDVNGYNFGDNTGTIYADSHGTHVAGTIAAETNNGIGMSGIAGGTGNNDGIRLMSCAVFGNFNSGGFPASYIYAADNGSVISQNSWGYTSPNNYEQAVLDAIDYFIAEAGKDEFGIQNGPMAGGIVIFAAGNDGTDNLWYPGYYDAVMAVAGTDHNDNKYTSSNFGSWVELAAPAVNIFSTIPNDNYTGGYNGTSMACPHVSGTAALVLSHFKDDGITPQQLWDRLVNATDPLTFDGAEDWGTGRVNAFKALAEDDGLPPLAIADMAIDHFDAISVTFTWTAPADQPDNFPATLYDFRWSANPITAGNFDQATPYSIPSPITPGSAETVTVKGLTPGTTYYFAVKSADYFGNTSEISNTVTATTLEAPEVLISGDPSVNVDVTVNPIETGMFNILNQGQAELSYNIFPVYTGRFVSQLQSTLIYPGTEVSMVPETDYQGIAELSSATAFNNNTAQFSFSNDIANIISYDDGDDEADGTIAVTASGTPVVWSAATAFDVPDLGGNKFILSQVSAYIDASGGAASQPTSMAIVAGGDLPSQGELIMMQEFTNIIGTQYVTIPLEMPVSFNTGDKFWIIFNFPDQPLRLGYDDITGGNRPGSYMVYLNGGWEDIQGQTGWSNYVWNVRAIQTQLQGVSLDISQGTLGIGASQNINVTYDLTDATRNGDYNFNIFVLSNDPVSPVKKIEATATVTGVPEPSIDVEPDTINSAIDVSVNPIKTETLTIYNNGEGELLFDLVNPVVETDIHIAPFKGEYPKGNVASSAGLAPSVSTEYSTSLPVVQLAGTTAYAQEVYPNSYFVSFSTDAPGTYLTSSTVSYTAYAGDFAKGDDKNMYVVDYDASELKKLNIETGALSSIGATLTFADLACDKNDGTMYGTYYADPSSNLYTIDLGTGVATKIGTIGAGIMISIACDGDGNLWGLNLDDNIYSIDKTDGHMTLVGAAGFDANYAQSMAWDPISDIIYLAAFNNGADRGELRILDTETGATQLVGAFPGNAEIAALGFPGGGSADFVSVSPTSGTVAANSSTTVQVQLDATTLPNGTYNSSLTVYSNDFDNPSTVVPVNLDVTGQVGEMTLSTEFIEFGAVFVNGEKEIQFIIANTGIGDLEISEITSNQALFTTDFTDAVVIELGDSLIVKAKFASAYLGQFNGILTIKSNDPMHPQMQITVTATAISPPVIALNPTEINETLDAGTQTTKQFTIHNYGLYPLQFSMPTVAASMLLNNPDIEKNNTSFIEGIAQSEDNKEVNLYGQGYPVLLGAGGPDDLGYSWIDSKEVGGPVYNWEEISLTGTEILPASDDGSIDVDLPFGFKFYGELKTAVKIGANGYLTFGTVGGDYSNDQIPSTSTPNNYIAPFWDDLRPSSKSGQVFYQAYADKFIVQYQEVGNYPSATTGTITFQVVLYPNGNIQFNYKEISLENNASATIGTENEDGTVGMQVAYNTDYVEDNLAVLLFPGRTPFDVTVSKVSGIIQPGGQQVIDITLDATDLIDGNYINELLISSNDPVRPETIFTSRLDVIGHPEINVSPESLEFGSIFQTLSKTLNLTIENTGSKDLTISSISSNNGSFTVDYAAPVIVAPTQSKSVEVTYTAINIGLVTGNITIESDDENGNETIQVAVSGTSLVPPVIGVTTDPSPLDVIMNSGDVDTVNVFIANTGGSPLNYVMVKPYYTNVGDISVTNHAPTADLSASEKQIDTRSGKPVLMGSGGPDGFGYTWVDNDQGTEVEYNWIEIKEIGTKLDLGGDNGVSVSLPFNFPFYNETYNEVQIASNGFFTFSAALGSIGGYSNQDIPSLTAPNNLIAPMWDDLEPQNGDGVYMYSTPDYVVIQYNEVPAFLSTGTATFQAVVYANGNMKFQYKDVMNYAGLNLSTVGIENFDGTDALSVVFNSPYVKDGLAVLIKSPFVVGTVDPGSTANVDLIIDATYIYDGFYEAPLKVLSNDPVTPAVEFPTTLTVTGTPAISLSETTVEFDSVYYVAGQSFSDTKALIIKNEGTKLLLIDSLWFSSTSAVFSADKSGAYELDPTEEMVVNLTFTPDAVDTFSLDFNVTSNDAANPVVTALLSGEAIEPPVMTVNPTDTLKLVLNSTEMHTENAVVSNLGGSMMNYSASVVYLPGGFSEAPLASLFTRTAISAPVYRALSQANIAQSVVYQSFDVDFKDSITYDPNGAPDDYYGYNATGEYSSANRFTVTTPTFKLTHIGNYYQNNGVTTPVILEVYKGGNLPGEGIFLTSQSFTHAEATAGANCLIELDNPQTFVQGDVFFVAIHYPIAINFPAAFNSGVSGVDGVSYWYDINSESWLDEDPGYVYKIRAYEAEGEVSTEWLSIDPSDGQLDAGASANHTLTANAAATTGGYHYAKVVYSSNDPITPVIEWPVQLYVNMIPEILAAPDTLYVNEGQIVNGLIVANDPDGGALDFEFAASYNFMDLVVQNDSATITYQPDYEQAGIHDFILNITDEKGETLELQFTVVVNNVNRTPALFTDIEDKLYFVSDPNQTIDLSAYFVDPDGEELTYHAFASTDTAFILAIDGNTLQIDPIALGYGVVTVTATDASGAYAAASFNVRIRHSENHAPTLVKAIPAIFYVQNRTVTIDLAEYFIDIDWDVINYSFEIYGNPTVAVSLAGSEMSFNKIRNGLSILTIYADDDRGGVTAVSALVFVYGRRNAMPFMSAQLSNKEYALSDKTDKIKLAEFFSDPDQDRLVYAFVLEDGNSVTTMLNNDVLEITPSSLGESTIVVYASDENTGFVEARFTATVKATTDIEEGIANTFSLNNYPNPFADHTTIEYQLEKPAKVRLEVMNIYGKTIEILLDEIKSNGKYTIDYDASGLAAGTYLYRITLDNEKAITKLMIIE